MQPDDICAAVTARWGLPDVVDARKLSDFVSVTANRLPHGSTAKLVAVAAGVTPPGWEPFDVMGRVLAGEQHGWSCHAHATVAAALLRHQGLDAVVDVTLRRDAAAAPVDFHSMVRVQLGSTEVLCDPYHAVGPVPLVAGAVTGAMYGMCDATGSHYMWHVRGMSRERTLTYVEVARDAAPDTLRAFADVSVGFSGVTLDHKAFVKTHNGMVRVASENGVAWTLSVSDWDEALVVVADKLSRADAFVAMGHYR